MISLIHFGQLLGLVDTTDADVPEAENHFVDVLIARFNWFHCRIYEIVMLMWRTLDTNYRSSIVLASFIFHAAMTCDLIAGTMVNHNDYFQ